MKKYIYLSMLSMAVLSSCDMEAPSKSSLDASEVYSQPELIESSVMAINQCWGETNSYRGRHIALYGMNNDVEWYNTPTYNSRLTGKYNATNYSTTPENDQLNVTKDPYVSLYQGIENANLAIENINQYGDKTNPGILQLLGEAMTLRALLYVELIKTYGDVPARFTTTTNENINLPRENKDVIYKKILADLAEAEAYVPWPGDSKTTMSTERVSKSFVKGLRARAALYAGGYSLYQDGSYRRSDDPELAPEKMYKIALDECVGIINSGKNRLGNSKGTNFEYNFQDLCGEITDAGNESIWEIPFLTGRGRVVSSKGVRVDPANNQWVNWTETGKTAGGECGPVPTFYYSFDPDDVRRDITCVPYKWGEPTNGRAKQEPYALKSLSFGKLRYEWVASYGAKRIVDQQDDGINWQIMRYADILMMAAEAENELNGPGAAVQYLKPILDRAFPSAPAKVNTLISKYSAGKDAFRQGIIEQRGFEFAGEMLRKQDLIRWGLLDQKLLETKTKLQQLASRQGEYADLPEKLYYIYASDGETMKIYGLNHGDQDDKDIAAAALGTTAEDLLTKGWITSSGTPTLTDDIINGLYVVETPSKRCVWPIPQRVINNSAGSLNNDFLK